MGGLAPWHWIIIIAALVVLFGSKRLPDAARGLGRSMRIFKTEIKEMQHEGGPTASAPETPPAAPPLPAPEAGAVDPGGAPTSGSEQDLHRSA